MILFHKLPYMVLTGALGERCKVKFNALLVKMLIIQLWQTKRRRPITIPKIDVSLGYEWLFLWAPGQAHKPLASFIVSTFVDAVNSKKSKCMYGDALCSQVANDSVEVHKYGLRNPSWLNSSSAQLIVNRFIRWESDTYYGRPAGGGRKTGE